MTHLITTEEVDGVPYSFNNHEIVYSEPDCTIHITHTISIERNKNVISIKTHPKSGDNGLDLRFDLISGCVWESYDGDKRHLITEEEYAIIKNELEKAINVANKVSKFIVKDEHSLKLS